MESDPDGESNVRDEITFTADASGFNDPEYEFGYRRAGTLAWCSQGASGDNEFSVTPSAGQDDKY